MHVSQDLTNLDVSTWLCQALDMGGPGGMTIGDAVFTSVTPAGADDPGVLLTETLFGVDEDLANRDIVSWDAISQELGDSDNDRALMSLTSSNIRVPGYELGTPDAGWQITFLHLDAGQTYQLQILEEILIVLTLQIPK